MAPGLCFCALTISTQVRLTLESQVWDVMTEPSTEAFLPMALILLLTPSAFLFLGSRSLVVGEIGENGESKPD